MPTRDYIFFDGACQPRNPGGTGGWGFVIKDNGGRVLKEGSGVMKARPDMTNNVAEYAAAGAAIKAYRDLGRRGPLVVCGDSMLVVKQMSGIWRAKQGAYVAVYLRLRELLKTCKFSIEWRWIPRGENSEADALSVKGLEEMGIVRGDR